MHVEIMDENTTQKKISRLKVILFSLVIYLGVHHTGMAIHVENEVIKLEEAFQRISQKYDVYFNYDREITMDIMVDYDDEYESLEDAISIILKNTNLSYQIFAKRFVVVFENNQRGMESLKEMIGHMQVFVEERETIRKDKSRIVPPLNSLMTKKIFIGKIVFRVQGTVVNQDGEPLIGVNIQVKDSSKGTATDFEGKFVLEDVDENAVLVISYVGYQTQEIPIAGNSELDIVLVSDSELLVEILVVGYGTQKKLSVTGAISDVPTKNIQLVATPSLSNALAGSMPGIVSRQSSGEPGYDGAAIFIRGFGTWENRNPLVLVDGVERDINNINTQEIESFTILKDASATAVYGVQGANGVILITTKRGQEGKPKITFRTEGAQLTALRLPEFINGYEYASLVNEALTNEGKNPVYQDDELQLYKDGSDPYFYPNVDWVNTVLKKNTSQTINNLSVNGGSDVFRYYTNVGYTILNGIYKQDPDNEWNNNAQMKRYNFRSNVDINLSSSLVMNLGIGGIIQKGNYPGRGAPDIFNSLRITSPINFPVVNPDGSVAGGQTSYLQENPYGLVARSGYSTQDRNTLQGTFGAQWDLSRLVTKGLSVRGMFSYDKYNVVFNDRMKPYRIRQLLDQDEDGDYIYRDPDIREEAPMNFGSPSSANRAYYGEVAVNYDRTFGDHTLGGMVLMNKRDYVDLTAGSSLGNLPYRRNGLASRLVYDYDNRYFLEFNMGYNGSENFPEGKQYGFFPSFSGGWVISNEKFWNSEVVNSVKIRGSAGQVGNDAIGGRRFLFLSTMQRGDQSYMFGDNHAYYPGLQEDQSGNPDVTWEVATKYNLGLDIQLFDGKINAQADAFKEDRTGILIQRGVVPRVAGYFPWSIPYANLGEAENYGLDALLEVQNTTRKGFYYSFRGNMTYAVSKRTKDDYPTFLYPYQNPIGNLIDQPFGLVSLGVFQSQEEIEESPRQTFMEDVQPGDIKYMDVNGDGVIDKYDEVPIGYPRTPQFVYGATFIATYKGFEASAFFQGVAKASIFIDGPSMYPFQMGLGTYNILREYYDHRWTPENPDGQYPRVSTFDNRNNNRTSTHFLQDASYLRLKSAEIAYNVKWQKLDEWKIENLRLFVNGANLITWDKIKVIDPESNYGTGGYPLQRIINFGLEITL